jgi:hypothetical protein
MVGERKASRASTAVRLIVAILGCVLSALSCSLPAARKDAVEVANTSTNTGGREAVNSSIAEATPHPAAPVSTPTPDSPIRKLDFANFSYPFPDKPLGRKKIKLRNGEQPPTRFSEYGVPRDIGYGFGDVGYDDLTGDNIKEAIVILNLIHSGSGIPSYVYIYTLRRNRPKLLWSFATGDRADGGYRKVAADKGELVIELLGRNKVIGTDLYADDGTNRGNCCPDSFTRTRYRWHNGRFRLRAKPEVIPLSTGTPVP